jgi:hypothetical protein
MHTIETPIIGCGFKPIRVNLYDKLFYIFYTFYRRNFGKKELPVYTSMLVMGMYFFSWILFVTVIIGKALSYKINLIAISNVFAATVICGVVYAFQRYYFYRQKRYLKIIWHLRKWHLEKVNLYFFGLIFGSILCFVVIGWIVFHR